MKVLLSLSFALAAALAAAGCSSPSKCAASDVPQNIEAAANGPAGTALATKGGQDVKNGADARDLSRTTPRITTGTGSGPTSSSTADNETRHTTSGGALACAFNAQTDPQANGGGGGQSLATQRAADTVTTLQGALALALSAQPYDPARVKDILAALTDAQKALAASSVTDRPNVSTVFNQQGVRNVQVPFSESATDGSTGNPTVQPSARTEAAKQIGAIGKAALEGSPPGDVPPPVPEPKPVPPPPPPAIPEPVTGPSK